MRFWLMKSEPDEVSIDDLAKSPKQTVAWFGVRNYQARNFMRDQMQVGDQAFFYHSSCLVPGIAGLVEVSRTAYPDATQFDLHSPYYDPNSSPDAPRWMNVDVRLVRKTPYISLKTLKEHPAIADMILLRKGNRLSITPVSKEHWAYIKHELMGLK